MYFLHVESWHVSRISTLRVSAIPQRFASSFNNEEEFMKLVLSVTFVLAGFLFGSHVFACNLSGNQSPLLGATAVYKPAVIKTPSGQLPAGTAAQ
jgi:hypothetical protein